MAYSYEDFDKIFEQLDQVLSDTNFDDVTSESNDNKFPEIPDGYYLCEVDSAEIKATRETLLPMASFQFTITEDGITAEQNESGATELKDISGTKGRKLFKNYVLKDSDSVKKFASDMLKFEEPESGEALLPKEAFINHETVRDALDLLVGMRIYVQKSTSSKKDKEGNPYIWNNLISWKRVAQLELPM